MLQVQELPGRDHIGNEKSASVDLIQVVRLRQGLYDVLRKLRSLFAGHKSGCGKLQL
jgi:hypothetical protein